MYNLERSGVFMDCLKLFEKNRVIRICERIPVEIMAGFYKSFDVEYAQNSKAIEGNTLALIQTKAILEDGISVGGKTLRKIYEVANHAKAFAFVKKCVREKNSLMSQQLKTFTHFLWKILLLVGFTVM